MPGAHTLPEIYLKQETEKIRDIKQWGSIFTHAGLSIFAKNTFVFLNFENVLQHCSAPEK